jgi:hypothetical protein
MTMVARAAAAAAVPLDELDPLQLLLGLPGYDDEDEDDDGEAAPQRARRERADSHDGGADGEDDEDEDDTAVLGRHWRARRSTNGRGAGARHLHPSTAATAASGAAGRGSVRETWTGEGGGTSVEMRSPTEGLGGGATGTTPNGATPSSGGRRLHQHAFSPMMDILVGDTDHHHVGPPASPDPPLAFFPTGLSTASGAGASLSAAAHADERVPSAAPGPMRTTSGGGGGDGRLPPSSAILIPGAPMHMKRKLAFRGTGPPPRGASSAHTAGAALTTHTRLCMYAQTRPRRRTCF